MKKITTTLSLLFICLFATSQENNPENYFGINYVSSIDMMKAEYEAGNISSLTSENLEYYTSILPTGGTMNLENATNIISTLQDTATKFTTLINSSSLSSISKEILIEVITNPNQYNADEMKAVLAEKVEIIKDSELSDEETKFTLSTIAILYNTVEQQTNNRMDCTLFGTHEIKENNSYSGINWGCAIVMGISGGATGFAICGWACAAVGFVVGGVLGAIS